VKKPDLSYIGPIIKQARLNADMTQEELGEKIGKTPRYLQAIENEGKGLSLNTFIQLIRILNLSADTIVYPERETDNGETEQLIRIIRLLNDRDQKILLAAAREMLKATHSPG